MEDHLKNHVIVCGYGLAGEKIVEILMQHGIKFVVIEIDPNKIKEIEEKKIECIHGDATSSNTLAKAWIEDAKAIAIAMDDDAKNLFALITAKSLNDKIVVVTRANDEFIKSKLEDAGANFVATPNKSVSDEIIRELSGLS